MGVTERIEAIVARTGTHSIWGYDHCLRVYELARWLGEQEGLEFDDEILHLSALLHDVGLYRAYNLRPSSEDHARRSTAAAEDLLSDEDVPTERIEAVKEAIESHPPGAPSGSTTEARLLKEAVALDYLGAVGLARTFAMVGIEEDVPDLASALRYGESLRTSIPSLLRLRSGRELAERRCAEMDRFLEGLRQELSADSS